MAQTLKFGNGTWATKKGSTLAYNDENGNYKPLPFDFTRASSATVINKDGLIETVSSGEPRIHFKDNTKGSLLLEPQRSNLITYSEDFSQWSSNNATITQNALTSPDGTVNADKIIATSTITQHRVDFTSSNASGSTSFSFFAKSAEYNSCWGRIGLSTALFDLENGLSVSTSPDITASIENYGNGWYRCVLTKSSSSVNEVCRINITTSYLDTSDFLGDNTSGIYLYGAQLEQGSYATSYIPTSGSAVTRVGESCFLKNEYVLSNSSGSIFFELGDYETNTNPNGFNKLMVFNEVSSSNIDNVIYIEEYNGLNTVIIRKGGSTVLQTTPSYQDLRGSKISIKFSNTEAKVFINGVLNQTYLGDASLNLEHFGFDNPYSGQIVSSVKLKNLKLYNTALTDQELIALTS